MNSIDTELLRAYAIGGDNAAFARLVDHHAAWIETAARRRLRDEHLAEDATQAVFMLLASKAAMLVRSDRASIAAWLFHAMHLTCCRLQRSNTRRQKHETITRDAPTRELPDDDLRAMLDDAIAQLPKLERQVIVRRFYQDQDYQTIGHELGCTAEAVRKRITRALVSVRDWMLQDGIDVVPDALLPGISHSGETHHRVAQMAKRSARIDKIARGALTMMQQAERANFTIWSAEFFVSDVEANLDFFEKLGFRRHFIDAPDAMGRIPRASLRGGQTARIWLRRASETDGTRPTPGMTIFFWIDGGASALTTHRDSIADQGLAPSAFFDDISLRNFTVTSPDGYSIGFFTAYK